MTTQSPQIKPNNDVSQINFNQLVLGFSSAALLYLGDSQGLNIKDKKSKNLPLAKYNIDILCLLCEKTKGNLSPDEKDLLNDVLTDLKAKYASAVKAPI